MKKSCKDLLRIFLILLIISCSSSNDTNNGNADEIALFTYKVINSFPHDTEAFTQGLVFEDGFLFEGTGLRGESTLRKAVLETGELLQIVELAPELFGEGVTVIGERIIQITLTSNLGIVYDQESFEVVDQFNYSSQGWGITHDGEKLIRSDGTSILHFHDPDTYEETGQVEVIDDNGPVSGLNELEFINGEIYANVFPTDIVAIISPGDGKVKARLDLTGLFPPEDRENINQVTNGIAYDRLNDRIIVTGKQWPQLFEIELVEVD